MKTILLFGLILFNQLVFAVDVPNSTKKQFALTQLRSSSTFKEYLILENTFNLNFSWRNFPSTVSSEVQIMTVQLYKKKMLYELKCEMETKVDKIEDTNIDSYTTYRYEFEVYFSECELTNLLTQKSEYI